MAVPFRKVSKTRRDMRRTHYKVTANGLVECTNCGAKIRPHRACPKCGFYKGVSTSKEEVKEVKPEVKKTTKKTETKVAEEKKAPKNYDAKVKLAFSAILCAVLCFLFPVASPLFFSLFLGVAVRESGMKHIYDFVSGPLLYGSTFMLGLLLGVLCDAHLLLDPKILKLLVLGIVALLLSGIGGIIGGYIMYFIKRGNYNPVIGIAAVSCVPTTAKVAQKIVSKDNPDSFVLGDALGANISGVITSAIITGIYITVIPYL